MGKGVAVGKCKINAKIWNKKTLNLAIVFFPVL